MLGGNYSPAPTSSSPAKDICPHPSQKSCEQSTEMTFNRRLANITSLVVRTL